MRRKLTVLGITLAMAAAFAGCSADAVKDTKPAEAVTVEETKEKQEDKTVETTTEAPATEAPATEAPSTEAQKEETKNAEVAKSETKDAKEVKTEAKADTPKQEKKSEETAAADASDKAAAVAEESQESGDFIKDMGIQGSWRGSIYTRVSASFAEDGAGYLAEVRWSGSYNEEKIWTMSLSYDSTTGKYSYSDAQVCDRTYADDGTYTDEILSNGGTGFFYLVDGTQLFWHDDENVAEYDEIALDFE